MRDFLTGPWREDSECADPLQVLYGDSSNPRGIWGWRRLTTHGRSEKRSHWVVGTLLSHTIDPLKRGHMVDPPAHLRGEASPGSYPWEVCRAQGAPSMHLGWVVSGRVHATPLSNEDEIGGGACVYCLLPSGRQGGKGKHTRGLQTGWLHVIFLCFWYSMSHHCVNH